VEVNLAVSQPTLPKEPQDTSSANFRESVNQLVRLDAGTFHPPLSRLKALVQSISVAP
jgi:hypothetical protein